MIDLHCHLLPGIDDGSTNIAMSLEMARRAVADGIEMTACTPHIYPGLFLNEGPDIIRRVAELQSSLDDAGIPLALTYGADIQMVPELLGGLQSGRMPTIAGSRYFLFEPPHHTVPRELPRLIFDSLAAGFVPVITHPERLTWLDDEHYPWFIDAAHQGAWLQLTSGAVTGRFGRTAKYWSERFLGDGVVHLLATDAHEPANRPPLLAEGRLAAEALVGPEEAVRLVHDRPRSIVENIEPGRVARPPGLDAGFRPDRGRPQRRRSGLISRIFGGRSEP
jgi:protein-tyrosine phosphatase